MKIALISVSDKTGIVSFARALVDQGYQIVSTGGTARHLTEHDVKNTSVSDVTGFPEILNGRVKTLHPKIHGGILAKSTPEHLETLSEHQIPPIDVVAVNLYPFAETVRSGRAEPEIVEQIDIGGPCMLRAAAKSFDRVWVVCDPSDYDRVLIDISRDDRDARRRLAAKAFAHTAAYDKLIAGYFTDDAKALRYGENPHQSAVLLNAASDVDVLHGKPLSFNNIIDASAGVELCAEFQQPAVVIVKHTNPAGCATGATIDEAFDKALACDPTSAFGGIVVLNRPPTTTLCEKLNTRFFEIVIAPELSADALEILRRKKQRRVIQMPITHRTGLERRETRFGTLEQEIDPTISLTRHDCSVPTTTQPTDAQWEQLLFAWRVGKHVKSNAIVLTRDHAAVGVGAGQMSRVDAVELAIKKSGGATGTVLASDAFFPFADGPELAITHGVAAIIQPGGSKRDQEVIDACDAHGIPMVFTSKRHFRHA